MMDLEDAEIEATYPDKFVCADCFEDDHLKAFIEDNVASKKCSNCGKETLRSESAASVDRVIERMLESISRRYGDAWENGSSYDNEEGRYFNDTWSIEDLLQQHVELSNGDYFSPLYQDIRDAFPSREWSTHDPHSATDAEIWQWGWEKFVKAVKHQRRFFFVSA